MADLYREPFRLFFPLAVLAGIIGVTLWPLMLGGWMTDYPGPRHARLMIEGFFGGFIFGFLGTSLPRLLEARALTAREVWPQLALHVACIVAYASNALTLGDGAFAMEMVLWFIAFGRRVRERRDLPPPTFALVAMAFGCVVAGLGIQTFGRTHNLTAEWELLARLLGFHGFILLAVLGAGGFLLPRFLGIGVREKYPTSITPTPAWRRAAWKSVASGALIIASYAIEAIGWPVSAALLRITVIGAFLWSTMPLERLRWTWNGVQWLLVTGLVCVPLGVLAAGFWPGMRIGLSHIELIGGFAMITFGVATRVVFGHSGNRAKLERFNVWLTISGVLMSLGWLSRISGDLVPSTMVSHYNYGAACWIAGLLIWAACVLPKVLTPDNEA